MATNIINGVRYSGNNITIKNGKVIIDGKPIDTGDAKEIKIEVQGDIETLDVDMCNTIQITGSVGNLNNGSGDVSVGQHVIGGVTCGSGNVDVDGDISGEIKTGSGNVKAINIFGNVKTGSGNVKADKQYIEK